MSKGERTVLLVVMVVVDCSAVPQFLRQAAPHSRFRRRVVRPMVATMNPERAGIEVGMRGTRSLWSGGDLVQEPSCGWPVQLGCALTPRPGDPWRKAIVQNYSAPDLCLDAQGRTPYRRSRARAP